MFVRYHMTAPPITMTWGQTVAEAVELLEGNNFRHVPIVNEEGMLQGMISDRDLRSARPSSVARSKERRQVEERVGNTPIAVIMTRDCLRLSQSSTLDDALLLFQSRKIGALPVIDDHDKVVGIFTMGDLMKAYRRLFGLGEKGSVLISIEDAGDPQAMSKLLRVLEDRQIPFTRLVRSEGSLEHKAMIFLRIRTFNVRSVHKALEAEGFTIHVPEMEI